MKNVHDLPPDTDAKYEEKKAILLWYYDVYLPAAAGKEAYGPTVRYYKRSTKACKVGGIRMPIIPLEVEAFGLLVFQNCFPKWQHMCPMEAKDSSWKVTKLDKNDKANAKYFVTEWTDGKTGQIQGGGWTQEGYNAFSDLISHVDKGRAADKANKWAVHELALELMRNEHGITDTSPPSKKRKRSGKVVLEDFKPGPKFIKPEVEDAYSVGSEDSSGEQLAVIPGLDEE